MERRRPLGAVERLKRALSFFFSCLLWQISISTQKLLMLLWYDRGSPVPARDVTALLGFRSRWLWSSSMKDYYCNLFSNGYFMNVGIWQLNWEHLIMFWRNQSSWSHAEFLPSSAAKSRLVYSLLNGTNPFVILILDSIVLLWQFVEFARIESGSAACVWIASTLFVPLVAGPRTEVFSRSSFATVV